jgi:hypothetical protein
MTIHGTPWASMQNAIVRARNRADAKLETGNRAGKAYDRKKKPPNGFRDTSRRKPKTSGWTLGRHAGSHERKVLCAYSRTGGAPQGPAMIAPCKRRIPTTAAKRLIAWSASCTAPWTAC